MTYDARQMSAVLTRCTRCGREYYMTAPKSECLKCEQVIRTVREQDYGGVVPGVVSGDGLETASSSPRFRDG